MLVDTDVLIWHLRGYPQATRRLDQLNPLTLSAVSYLELLQGMRSKAELVAVKKMLGLRRATIWPLTEAITHRATELMEMLTLSHGLGASPLRPNRSALDDRSGSDNGLTGLNCPSVSTPGNDRTIAMIAISSLHLDRKSLEVRWNDNAVTRYPWIWLRDHAHDDGTMHPVTQQRQLFTAALPPDLAATAAAIEDDSIAITWNDGSPNSVLPVSFLARYRTACGPQLALNTHITLWNAAFIRARVPTVAYAAVMNTEDGVREWLSKTSEFGFCLALGTPATAEATEALLRRIGYVRETIFGGMWEFTADLAKADTAYTNLELRPHTDGTYSHDAPGVQLLHCLQFEGTGGESMMVDAFAVARHMQAELPAHFTTLARVDVPGQYIGDGAHLMAARPVFRHDHNGKLVQVSFNNYDRAPFLLPEPEMIAFYEALRVFDNLVNDSAMQWRHVLAPGEALLFDNWRVLHGRASYTGLRRMCGGYVNREDVESRLRQLS